VDKSGEAMMGMEGRWQLKKKRLVDQMKEERKPIRPNGERREASGEKFRGIAERKRILKRRSLQN